MNDLRTLMYALAIKDGIWPKLPVVAANAETGEIVYTNRFAASIFGYTVAELLGQPIEKLVPLPLQDAHAVWRQDVSTPKLRLMGLGRQVYGVRKDGTVFPASVTLTSVEIEGRVYGVALIVDLTGIMTGVEPEHGPLSPSPDVSSETVSETLRGAP